MTLRFRRSIRILSGLRLNVGKRGASVSIGVKGAHITVGHGQVRETLGLPGSGLSYTHVDKTHGNAPEAAQAPAVRPHVSIVKLLMLAVLVWALVHFIRHPG